MPYITIRLGAGTLPGSTEPNPTLKAIQRFYYDTAQAFNPYTLASLTRLVPASHLLFGTDR